MKLLQLNDIPTTIAHDNLKRQRFVAPGDLKSNVQTVNYVVLKSGESYSPHRHPDCEECFFVIEGKAKAEIENKIVELKKGDFLAVEQNELHVFTNTYKSNFIYFQFRILI